MYRRALSSGTILCPKGIYDLIQYMGACTIPCREVRPEKDALIKQMCIRDSATTKEIIEKGKRNIETVILVGCDNLGKYETIIDFFMIKFIKLIPLVF